MRSSGSQRRKVERRSEERLQAGRAERRPPAIRITDEAPQLSLAGTSPSSPSPLKNPSISQFLVRDESGNTSITPLDSPVSPIEPENPAAEVSPEEKVPASSIDLPSKPEEQTAQTAQTSQNEPNVITEVPAPTAPEIAHERTSNSADWDDRKMSTQSRDSPRLSEQPTFPDRTTSLNNRLQYDDDPYDFSKYEYKPKVKLGPRPVAMADKTKRPSVAKVAGLPAQYKPLGKKQELSSPMSQKAAMASAATASAPPPVAPLSFLHSPPPVPQTAEYDHRPVSRGSIKSMTSQRSTAMTPDKIRLMKAVELRKKQLKKANSRFASSSDQQPKELTVTPMSEVQETKVQSPKTETSEAPADQRVVDEDQAQSSKADSGIEMGDDRTEGRKENSQASQENTTNPISRSDEKEFPIPSQATRNVQSPIEVEKSLAASPDASTIESTAPDSPKLLRELTSVISNDVIEDRPSVSEDTIARPEDNIEVLEPEPKDLGISLESFPEIPAPPAAVPQETFEPPPETFSKQLIASEHPPEHPPEISPVTTSVQQDSPEPRVVKEQTSWLLQDDSSDEEVDQTTAEQDLTSNGPDDELLQDSTSNDPGEEPLQDSTSNDTHERSLDDSPNMDDIGRTQRRRGLVQSLHADANESGNPDDFISEDDDFLEELQSATLQEAKPIVVARSPSGPAVHGRRPSANSTYSDATTSVKSVNISRTVAGVRNPTQAERITPDPINVPHYHPKPPTEKQDPVTGLARNVSTGISKRIQALEKVSGRDSPNHRSPDSSTTNLLPRDQRDRTNGSKPVKPRPTSFRKSHNRNSSIGDALGASLSSENAPAWTVKHDPTTNRNSVTVKAKIVRPNNDAETGKGAGPLQQSELMINHVSNQPAQSTDSLPRLNTQYPQSMGSSPSSAPLSPPLSPTSADSRTLRSSNRFARHRQQQQQQQRVASPQDDYHRRMPSRGTTSSKVSSTHNDDGTSQKEESRSHRFFKRMSNLSVGSNKRKSNGSGHSAPPAVPAIPDANSMPAPPVRDIPPAEPVVEKPDTPPAVVVGDLNVQFPDSLVSSFFPLFFPSITNQRGKPS